MPSPRSSGTSIRRPSSAGQGPVEHTPVLSQAAIEILQPGPGDVFLDGTFGGGGHSRLILDRIEPGGVLVAMDRDPAAALRAEPLRERYGESFRFAQGDFAECSVPIEALDRGEAPVAGALLDLGLSSFQLGDPQRGFSFLAEGPLDMRFDPSQPLTAAVVVNRYPEERLRQVIRDLGQEPWATKIAASIARARHQAPLLTTTELAALIARTIPRRFWPRRIHPATRTFQALRMEVNDELGSLRRGLEEIVRLLLPGGRLVVISFHSLEDKVVKDFLHVEARDCICPPQQPVCTCGPHQARILIHPPHPLRPGKGEIEANPRSRSARLRGAIRLPAENPAKNKKKQQQ